MKKQDQIEALAAALTAGAKPTPTVVKKTAAIQKTAQELGISEPGPLQKQAIQASRDRRKGRMAPVRVKIEMQANGVFRIAPPHTDEKGWWIQLTDVFGSNSMEFSDAQMVLLINAIGQKGVVSEVDMNGTLALISGIAPANEMEGALATQIAAAHMVAMRMMTKAAFADNAQSRDSFINATTKLQRTMTAQIEALASIRRGGKQQVVVKHVHVHQGPGGQAIVGDMHHAGGDRGKIGNGSQAHATITGETLAIAGGETLWCEDPAGEAVPIARGSR